MEIVVEPFVPQDHAPVVALVLDIQQNEFRVPITLDDQPDLADVPGFYGHGAGGFWVARDIGTGAIVGTVGLLPAGPDVALRKMFVRRDVRGKQLGVAARLFEALLAHARARGIARIFLGTRPDMHAAHRFYEKNGFVRIDEAALPATFPRAAVDTVFYRRALAE